MVSAGSTRKTTISTLMVLFAVAALTAPALAGDESTAVYEVTITNLTYDQIISPPVVVLHDDRFRLFAAGQPAGPELAPLAEDAGTGPLVGLLEASDGVADYAVAGGGILPGGSIAVELSGPASAKRVSAVGMLVSTNDAFFGVAGAAVPNGRSGVTLINAPAYDAGSEANTESCAHIPGPPCGNGGVRVTDGAEGFVHVHRGVHGNGDLDAAGKDWRNPAARVTVRRVDR